MKKIINLLHVIKFLFIIWNLILVFFNYANNWEATIVNY